MFFVAVIFCKLLCAFILLSNKIFWGFIYLRYFNFFEFFVDHMT